MGPYLFNKIHWLALIIDVIRKKFILIDPKLPATPLSVSSFNSFQNYYASRTDFIPNFDWINETIEHPIQQDNSNCGVFVIGFISNNCQNSFINFSSTEIDLFNFRQLVAEAIVENSEII